MNIIGIDIDALEKRRSSLQAELQTIEAVLQLARNGAVKQEAQLPPVVVPTQQPTQGRSGYKQGLQKKILLALSTGPAKLVEIAQAVEHPHANVAMALSTALSNEYITCKQDLYTLTTLGIQAVKWFQAHSHMIVLRSGWQAETK
jgi:hypothetical protein